MTIDGAWEDAALEAVRVSEVVYARQDATGELKKRNVDNGTNKVSWMWFADSFDRWIVVGNGCEEVDADREWMAG